MCGIYEGQIWWEYPWYLLWLFVIFFNCVVICKKVTTLGIFWLGIIPLFGRRRNFKQKCKVFMWGHGIYPCIIILLTIACQPINFNFKQLNKTNYHISQFWKRINANILHTMHQSISRVPKKNEKPKKQNEKKQKNSTHLFLQNLKMHKK